MTKAKLKQKFVKFFEKHPHIKSMPFVMNIVIPKYECKGERTVRTTGELFEDDDIYEQYKDIADSWEDIMSDIPNISEKDSFYLFDEDVLVTVNNTEDGVKFDVVDCSDEILNMY